MGDCPIEEQAWRAFDNWLAAQSEEVQDMDILEQIELYAAATQFAEAA